jgi:hypothetical protein
MDFHNKLECLSLDKSLQPRLMFVGKVGVYPSEVTLRCSTLG